MPTCRVRVVAKEVYVSDADIELSKDLEGLRIDRHLVADLSSMMPGRRRKMVDRIEEHATANLATIVPILVKHYNHDNPRVRSQVRSSLTRLTSSETGEQALIECMFSRNEKISNTAAVILEEKNYNSLSFLSLYRQTKNLVLQAWSGEVFSQDIEELIVDSIETYKEGRFDQGMTNLKMARDLLEDRLEWHSHLRTYMKDVLKLTPMLSRSGVQVDSIQDSIRNLASAIPDRDYREARALLDLRRQETRLWKQLWSLEEFVAKRVTSKPSIDAAALQDPDRRVLESFVSMAGRVQEAIQNGAAPEALNMVSDFIRDDVSARYLASEGNRLEEGDEAACHTMWSVGLALLKLVAPVIPNVAEEFYQQYFRDREDSASVHSVRWPEPMSSLET
ncbi:MAG: class I tRNA ligase family protein [Methanobacteriota archaeon]|nr:MAG: class I tRNA ligase family protein [Euryarchaeota archaeon]